MAHGPRLPPYLTLALWLASAPALGSDPPEPYRIHAIRIEGNEKTRDEVVIREFLVHPGDLYRQSRVDQTRDLLRSLGIFRTVDIAPRRVRSDTGSPALELVIRVAEQRRGLLFGGGGFSRSEGLMATLDAQIPNLRGMAQRLDTAIDLGTRRRRLSLGFRAPWILGRPLALSARVTTSSQEYEGRYRLHRETMGLRFDARRRSRVTPWVGIVFHRDRYHDVVPETEPSLFPTSTSSALRFGLLADSGSGWGRGDYTFEVAPGGPLGDLSYHGHRWLLELRRRVSVSTLAIDARCGLIDGFTDEDNTRLGPRRRFTPGGVDWWDGQVRGYPDHSLGPRSEGVVVGGRAMAVLNAEVRVPIGDDRACGLLFADVGNAWESASDIELRYLKRSAGLGLRLWLPQGNAVGLDLGYGFDRRGVDGRPPSWRLHLQIGPRTY